MTYNINGQTKRVVPSFAMLGVHSVQYLVDRTPFQYLCGVFLC